MPEKTYSIADTKAHLSELAEKAATGETVVITRRGKPIARLAPLGRRAQPIDLQQLRALTERASEQPENAATLLRRMRDEQRY